MGNNVVRLPRDVGRSDWLSNELALFPPEFLAFSPHVRRLELHDAVTHGHRAIEVTEDGPMVTIADGITRSQWRVFRHRLRTSDLTADEVHDAEVATLKRDTLALIWAVPLEISRHRGRFWAFFPTETETTLRGILSAPWKTNADRCIRRS